MQHVSFSSSFTKGKTRTACNSRSDSHAAQGGLQRSFINTHGSTDVLMGLTSPQKVHGLLGLSVGKISGKAERPSRPPEE